MLNRHRGRQTMRTQTAPSDDGGVIMSETGVADRGGADPVPEDEAQPACYAPGTRIATPTGEIAIEHIEAGTIVLTASGAHRRVIWTGKRSLRLDRHKRPADVQPIRIHAHAFGPGRPARDLLVSPDHAIFDDQSGPPALIPARYLLNDITIVQERMAHITWHHFELKTHDVVLAEGLPSETYLDIGNRHSFENNGTLILAMPNFARTSRESGGYAPLVTKGARLEAMRIALDEEGLRALDEAASTAEAEAASPRQHASASATVHRLAIAHQSAWHRP